ncbi:unnamed protein product, partial [marine sediment metagenome]
CAYDGNDNVLWTDRAEYDVFNKTICMHLDFGATGNSNGLVGTRDSTLLKGDYYTIWDDRGGQQRFSMMMFYSDGGDDLHISYSDTTVRD